MSKKLIIYLQISLFSLLIWTYSVVHCRANTNEQSIQSSSNKPFYDIHHKGHWTQSMRLLHPLGMTERAIAEEQRKRINQQYENTIGVSSSEEVDKNYNTKLNELYGKRDQLALKVIDYWKQHPEEVSKGDQTVNNQNIFQRLQKEEQALRERVAHPQIYDITTYTSLVEKVYTLFIRKPDDCQKYMVSENIKDRLEIISVLSGIDDPAYKTLISVMLNDSNDKVREAAVKALGVKEDVAIETNTNVRGENQYSTNELTETVR